MRVVLALTRAIRRIIEINCVGSSNHSFRSCVSTACQRPGSGLDDLANARSSMRDNDSAVFSDETAERSHGWLPQVPRFRPYVSMMPQATIQQSDACRVESTPSQGGNGAHINCVSGCYIQWIDFVGRAFAAEFPRFRDASRIQGMRARGRDGSRDAVRDSQLESMTHCHRLREEWREHLGSCSSMGAERSSVGDVPPYRSHPLCVRRSTDAAAPTLRGHGKRRVADNPASCFRQYWDWWDISLLGQTFLATHDFSSCRSVVRVM